MTDRELLKAAARAAGIVMLPHLQEPNVAGLRIFGGWWNPLTDDGDALRLAVKLGMTIYTPEDPDSRTDLGTVYVGGITISEDGKPDPYAATRRAVVRAAAAIGKDMSNAMR